MPPEESRHRSSNGPPAGREHTLVERSDPQYGCPGKAHPYDAEPSIRRAPVPGCRPPKVDLRLPRPAATRDFRGRGTARAFRQIPGMKAVTPERPVDSGAVDGDAGSYLDELIADAPAAEPAAPPDQQVEIGVEVVGPHLRLAGSIGLGRFARLTDRLNHHEGLLLLRDATVLRRNGSPTRVTTASIWMNLGEVTLVGEAKSDGPGAVSDLRIVKESRTLVVVTPGHTLTGEVYIPIGAELAQFIESVDPAFIPMTDVRTRSLADRRVISRYEFALVNRRHIVAATEAPQGMIRERNVL